MNIKHIEKSNKGSEHWLLEPDSTIIEIQVYQLKNRSGASVTLVSNIVDTQSVPAGQGGLAIVLPIGQWTFSRSSDGKVYNPVTTLNSVDNPPYGPSQRINNILDNSSYPPVWARYNKVGAVIPKIEVQKTEDVKFEPVVETKPVVKDVPKIIEPVINAAAELSQSEKAKLAKSAMMDAARKKSRFGRR